MKSISLCIKKRKSIRSYLSKHISLELVKQLLIKASKAPSGGNTQP